MTLTRCPEHSIRGRGVTLDSRGWCWWGDHYPESKEETVTTKTQDNPTTLSTVVDGVAMEGELGTAEGDAVVETVVRGALGMPADPETGEVYQPTLDDAIFPAVRTRAVPMVKIGFSGSVEMTMAQWRAYCQQGLEPGREVTVTMSGYLPEPHARWVKRTETDPATGEKDIWWEQEGVVKVKALELGEFELGGIYRDV